MVYESYDPNPTRPTVKKNNSKPNPRTLKNLPNLVGWVGLGWSSFGELVGSLHTPSTENHANFFFKLILLNISLSLSLSQATDLTTLRRQAHSHPPCPHR